MWHVWNYMKVNIGYLQESIDLKMGEEKNCVFDSDPLLKDYWLDVCVYNLWSLSLESLLVKNTI